MSTGGAFLEPARAGLSRLDLYDRIRADIIGNALPPGSGIPESHLVQRYAAGRSPLREALMRLAGEGLVRVIPQVGTFVAPLDPADIREANTVRSLLECEAAAACAREGGAVTGQLAGIVAMQGVALERADFAGLLQFDSEFHQAVVIAGIGPMAWRVVSQMRGHFLRVRNLSVPDPQNRRASVEAHAKIADAIARADPVAAEAAMQDHMRANHDQLLRLQNQHPDFFEVTAPTPASARSP